jgi:hypothetical protein
MTFDARNLPGIVAVLICVAFAVWLWRIGTRGSTARQLSVVLAIEGLTILTSGALQFGVVYPATAPPLNTAEGLSGFLRAVLHHVGDVALVALYPPFLASALRTRWTLLFSKRWVRVTLIEVPLIAYGILSTQLFDIDLRPWPGLVAGALIVYLLAPLQRVAERFANRLMPGTAGTPEYLAYRKMQVYEAALTEALGVRGSPRRNARSSQGFARLSKSPRPTLVPWKTIFCVAPQVRAPRLEQDVFGHRV